MAGETWSVTRGSTVSQYLVGAGDTLDAVALGLKTAIGSAATASTNKLTINIPAGFTLRFGVTGTNPTGTAAIVVTPVLVARDHHGLHCRPPQPPGGGPGARRVDDHSRRHDDERADPGELPRQARRHAGGRRHRARRSGHRRQLHRRAPPASRGRDVDGLGRLHGIVQGHLDYRADARASRQLAAPPGQQGFPARRRLDPYAHADRGVTVPVPPRPSSGATHSHRGCRCWPPPSPRWRGGYGFRVIPEGDTLTITLLDTAGRRRGASPQRLPSSPTAAIGAPVAVPAIEVRDPALPAEGRVFGLAIGPETGSTTTYTLTTAQPPGPPGADRPGAPGHKIHAEAPGTPRSATAKGARDGSEPGHARGQAVRGHGGRAAEPRRRPPYARP